MGGVAEGKGRRMPRTRLPPHPDSASTARRFVADVLLGRGFSEGSIERAVLLTSELVTDAVSRTHIDVEVVVAAEQRMVRVEVRDASPPTDALEASTAHARQLVDAMSEAWGVDQVAASGRSTWFEMRA